MDQLAREILERGIYLDVAYRYRSSRWEAYDYAGDLIADGTDKEQVIRKTIKKLQRELARAG